MAELFDYRTMLGITEKMSDEELQDEIGKFRTAFKEQANDYIGAQRKREFLQQNLSTLERKAEERRLKKIRDSFTLKPEHVLLLQKMEFQRIYAGELESLFYYDFVPKYDFKTVTIQLGYKADAARSVFEFRGITLGMPNTDWYWKEIAPKPCFIIKLGNQIK